MPMPKRKYKVLEKYKGTLIKAVGESGREDDQTAWENSQILRRCFFWVACILNVSAVCMAVFQADVAEFDGRFCSL